jgi:uncharacterized membrane protein
MFAHLSIQTGQPEVVMKQAVAFILGALGAGLLVVVPIYLALLLLLKALGSVARLVQPVAKLLPDSIPAETALSLLLVLFICLVVGLAIRTRAGQAVRNNLERRLFVRIPGYAVLRNLTQQIAGQGRGNAWKPALFQSDEGLVPAFIIEKFDDGRYTIFVPSIPTPFAGAVYVLEGSRVHPVDVPFTQALNTVSRWGAGARDLVAAMEKANPKPSPHLATATADAAT